MVKPMARNSQIWTQDYRLLLDGPTAGKEEISAAVRSINRGGLFGYRFHYPPMRVGSYQIYWHRPAVACLRSNAEKPAVLTDAPLGYLTAYNSERIDLDHPIELWPRLCRRNSRMEVIELFKGKEHEQKTVTRVLNLLEAQEHLRREKASPVFCETDLNAAGKSNAGNMARIAAGSCWK